MKNSLSSVVAAIGATLLLQVTPASATLPEGFKVVPSSISPDGRLGVGAPDEAHYDEDLWQNQLVEVATGRVVAEIEGETGMEDMNHGGLSAKWSADSSLLLWVVEGKWFPRAAVLLQVSEGKLQWQINILQEAQEEILARAKEARPNVYAMAVTQNKKQMGSAYPDGFTVDVKSADDSDAAPSLPLSVRATLTSNPKGMEDFPKAAALDAVMTATIDAQGEFHVTHFELSPEG